MNEATPSAVPLNWTGMQSALHTAGTQATLVEQLWWLMLGISVAVWVAVIGATLYAQFRRRAQAAAVHDADPRAATARGGVGPHGEPERRAMKLIAVLTCVTAGILAGLFGANLYVGHAAAQLARAPAMTIEITGYRWWWEVRYMSDDAARIFTTANELRLPVGRAVRIVLISGDVIHSFWAPGLQGKLDLIPGRRNELFLRADAPGIFRGQCAEFCGLQHAKMAFMVVASTAADFDAWVAQRLRPASEPRDAIAQQGHTLFMQHCAACHAIGGTLAQGNLGPDLSHLASRLTIAAGTLPNTRSHLGGWIANAQHIKPGSLMPAMPLSGAQLRTLLHYLEGLR